MKNNIRAIKLLNTMCPGYFIVVFLKSVFNLLSPYVSLYLSAEILDEVAQYQNLERLTVLAVSAVLAVFLSSLIGGWFEKIHSDNEELIEKAEMALYNEKALELDYADIENPKTAELRRDIGNAKMLGGRGLPYVRMRVTGIIEGTVNLIYALVLFSELFRLILSAKADAVSISILLLILVSAACIILYKIKSETIRSRLQSLLIHTWSDGQRFDEFLDSYTIGKDIRIYNQEKMLLDIKKSAMDEQLKISAKKSDIDWIVDAVGQVFSFLMQALTYGCVIIYTIRGVIGIGSLLKYVGSLNQVISSVTNLIEEFISLRGNREYLDKLFCYLDIPSDTEDAEKTGKKKTPITAEEAMNGVFELKNVSFRYPGSDVYALKNLSLSFRMGNRVAVVGLNGSGKTTFIKLLCRLYAPTEGEILLNGVNIREYDLNQYLRAFSVVFQDFTLLPFKLGENVATDETYDSERVGEILRRVGIKYTDPEMYLYKNFDESGIEISGGEAQKIALARALYKNAPIMILDEPTAALDPRSEYEIYTRFDEIAQNKTVIYISHRLASCRFCDDILVFDGGCLVQRGSHDELLTQEGQYHTLWTAQAQYYVLSYTYENVSSYAARTSV